MRNERLLVAVAAGLVLAGGITYVATARPVTAAGPVTAQHPAAPRPTSKPVPPAVVAVSPADGVTKAAPDTQVRVTASGGALTQVTVTSGNSTVTGQYEPGGATWSSRWGLKPGTSYVVTFAARNSKGTVTTGFTHFTTKSAAQILKVSSITPNPGEIVGVGMPVIVDFNYDVAPSDRAAVEHALEVGSDVPVTGAWFWASGSEVVFRPQSYWPAHEHVQLTAHLAGVPGGPGLWGGSDLSQSFTIGDSHLVTVNLKTDRARFYTDGSLARTIPVSGGTGGYDSFGNDFYTTSGVHLTMGSVDSLWMTSPNIKPDQPGYYHELVYDDVQISASGEYMHQSPGGEWCLGHANCSHGCVRMTADGAAWWRHTAYRGDPVTITGTPRGRRLSVMRDHWWWRPGWRPGRRMYTWHVTFGDQPAVQDLAARARDLLRDVPGLDLIPGPWLHLTTQGVGFSDEVSAADLAAITAAARSRLAAVPPAAVTIGPARVLGEGIGCDAHPAAALTPVRKAVRAAISDVWGAARVPDEADWWPHVSLGYASADGPATPAETALAGFTAAAAITVTEVQLILLSRDAHLYQWETQATVRLGAPGR